ncbi:Wolframin [Larimichthys crocea]|uniref:Uncharacterized protein n=1 Tax=Larimichthys crocea TaxID=215358 RepID=A0ACD3RW16_LARCR|nr:Wolframin [Larimichthys crocea]
MEKDLLSTPTAVNTQGSRPVLGGSTPPSPTQIPPSLDSSNLSAAPSQSTKSPSSTENTREPRKSHSSHPSAHVISKPMDSPPSLEGSKTPAGSSKPSSPAPNKTPLVTSPNRSPAQVTEVSPVSKPSSASSACNAPADSPSSSSTSSSSTSTSTTAPAKRTFASMAKRVIIQERLRKAEEDAHDDEDDEEPEEDLTVEQMEEKAKAGDAGAQTRLGQHYLILAEEKDAELNNLLGVNWLIKAAKQGRKKAAKALQRCWIQKKGITPENEADVRKLSTESKFELAHKDELVPSHKRAHKTSWGFGGSGMMLDSQQTGAIRKAMDMKSRLMMLQYPLHSIIEMKEHLVDWASRAGVQWLSTIIPTQHVNALIFFFIISSLTVDLFAFVIPLLVFYLSFISMIICTLRVFQSSKTWENFRALTSLLTRFEPGLDVEQAETNFGWNNLEPYLYFILSVFFVIFSFPVADKGWIPCSELSTVAIFFTAVSYKSLSPTAAAYARRAMLIEVASSLCCLTQFLPEQMAIRLLGRTFATLPLGDSVVLKLSLPCLLYVYLFYLFFSMARIRGFRGTYCVLVPYLVCFMWCEFSVVLLQSSSVVGLIRTLVAYFLFLFALPVLAFGLAAMLFIQLFKWFLELEVTKMIVTLVVCAIPVTLRLWTRFSMSILDVFRSLTHRGPVKLILLCISMVILFFSIYVYHAEVQKVYNSTMTWKQYSQEEEELCQIKALAKNTCHTKRFDSYRI